MDWERLRDQLGATTSLKPSGRVIGLCGTSLRLLVPNARIGDLVTIKRQGAPLAAEIIGFDHGEAVALPLAELGGVGINDEVESTNQPLRVPAHASLLGHVLDGLGQVLDAEFDLTALPHVAVDRPPPSALSRRRITQPFHSGVRAVDAFLTLGIGQRVGLFSGAGSGKSTLLGMIARAASADAVVVALVGERGREVKEFLEIALGESGRKRAVVVAATSDAPALQRLRAAQTATCIAEYFRDQGQTVLLLVDSLTRVARAQREVGLAAGEPPARRGYPPSVFTLLPRLLERAGQSDKGSITAIYTVLVEGNDLDEPVADEVRGMLDGHIVLSREIAARGQFPAIDIGASLSRVMESVVPSHHLSCARAIRTLLATYEAKRELVSLGAYKAGSDAVLDQAIERWPSISGFLTQDSRVSEDFFATSTALQALCAGLAL